MAESRCELQLMQTLVLTAVKSADAVIKGKASQLMQIDIDIDIKFLRWVNEDWLIGIGFNKPAVIHGHIKRLLAHPKIAKLGKEENTTIRIYSIKEK